MALLRLYQRPPVLHIVKQLTILHITFIWRHVGTFQFACSRVGEFMIVPSVRNDKLFDSSSLSLAVSAPSFFFVLYVTRTNTSHSISNHAVTVQNVQTIHDLKTVFHLPINDAAKKVSVNTPRNRFFLVFLSFHSSTLPLAVTFFVCFW